MTTSTSKVESSASAAKDKETPDAKKKGGNISRTTNRATIPYRATTAQYRYIYSIVQCANQTTDPNLVQTLGGQIACKPEN